MILTLLVVLTIFAVGYVEGLQGAGRSMQTFPSISPRTKLLIVSPHPDDEILVAGGLIQEVLKAGGEVKVVFLTSGDGSRDTVNRENEFPDFSPGEYIAVGEIRMQESLDADTSLGIPKNDIIFLGFPDGGLNSLYYKHFSTSDGNDTSQTTQTDTVPYDLAYQKGQPYLGKYLVKDLQDIIQNFKPDYVVTTGSNDTHPDHKIAYYATLRAREGLAANWPIYKTIVHYYNYPPKSGTLIPPKKIFSNNWYTLGLTANEREIKLSAGKKYVSQYGDAVDRNLFTNLTAKNEIFEKE